MTARVRPGARPRARSAITIAAVLLLGACGRGGPDAPAAGTAATADSAAAPAPPRTMRDTLLPRSRRALYDAALRTLADSGYRLEWFDAAAGGAELTKEPGIWILVGVQRRDSSTRFALGASRTPAGSAADPDAPHVSDDTLAARAAGLFAAIVRRSATPPPGDLLADSARIRRADGHEEVCRPARIGDRWLEIDTRTVTGRCPTSALFRVTPNVAVVQRVDRLTPRSLVETCRSDRALPRGWAVAFTYSDAARCKGRGAGGQGNIVVLRKVF